MVCSVRTGHEVDNDSPSSSEYEEDQRHFEGYSSEPNAGCMEVRALSGHIQIVHIEQKCFWLKSFRWSGEPIKNSLKEALFGTWRSWSRDFV